MLQEINIISTLVRLLLAVAFGGAIGLERMHKGRPAGFRTYMLVCLGATLAMMLGQYIDWLYTSLWIDTVSGTTDVSRLGAQVINGIGFLGAGTILLTSRSQIKGLTTAAGLWMCACMGLAIGAGFYLCAVMEIIIVLVIMRVLPTVEDMLVSRGRNMNLFVGYRQVEDLAEILDVFRRNSILVYDVEFQQDHSANLKGPEVVIYARLPKRMYHAGIQVALLHLPCVRCVDEI